MRILGAFTILATLVAVVLGLVRARDRLGEVGRASLELGLPLVLLLALLLLGNYALLRWWNRREAARQGRRPDPGGDGSRPS